MMVMVSAERPDHALSRPRTAEPVALRRRQLRPRLGALDRGRAQVFRPRRARLGHAALRRLADLRLCRHDRASTGLAKLFGGGAQAVHRPDHRPRLRHGRARLQGLGGAVPHVDPGRLRRRPDPGHRVLLGGAEDRRDRAVRALPDRAVRRPGGRVAAGHRVPVGRLDGARRGRRDRPDQHQAADGLQLDRPCRLRADRPRRGQPEPASAACWSTWRSTCS